MKKSICFAGIMLIICLSIHTHSKAQKTASYIPQNGFWVIVSNINTKKEAVVQYYNDDKVMIYEEKIIGRNLNLRRKKTLRSLKRVLDQALAAFKIDKHKIVDKNWVATALR